MTEKKAAGGTAVGPERTRQAVKDLLASLQADSLEEAFSGDEELMRQSVASEYGVVNAYFRLVTVFARYIDSLSQEERTALLASHYGGLDGSEVAGALNAWSSLVMKVHEENPGLIEAGYPAMERVFAEVDFGKLRVAIAGLSDYFATYMTHVIEVMMENPVVVANIMGTIPPVANSLLKVISELLASANLPPEILASALFNTLSAVDAEELGRLITTVSQMTIDLHAGNYILGGTEPRFRQVFADFMKRLMDNVDDEALNDAVVAFAEDAEVMAAVLAELIARDPEKVVLACRTGTSLSNVMARIATNAFAEANAWPDELLVRMAGEIRELDANEIGKAIDAASTLALRMREANPTLNKDVLAGVLSGINTERLEFLFSAAATDTKEALLENAGVRKALEPEEMGRRLNDALVRFNASAAGRPGAIADYATRLLAVVDTRQLLTAGRTVTHGMIDAVFAQRERALGLLKLGAGNIWRVARHLLNIVGVRSSSSNPGPTDRR